MINFLWEMFGEVIIWTVAVFVSYRIYMDTGLYKILKWE